MNTSVIQNANPIVYNVAQTIADDEKEDNCIYIFNQFERIPNASVQQREYLSPKEIYGVLI